MTKTSVAPEYWRDDDCLSHEQIDELLEAARVAAEHAYVPYSNFRVGAAVLTADGSIIVGCNIENASYSLVCCAERTAMFSAIAQGHTNLVALAVTCPDGNLNRPRTLMPCGACRQVMAELLAPNAAILIDSRGRFGIEDLLPQAFSL